MRHSKLDVMYRVGVPHAYVEPSRFYANIYWFFRRKKEIPRGNWKDFIYRSIGMDKRSTAHLEWYQSLPFFGNYRNILTSFQNKRKSKNMKSLIIFLATFAIYYPRGEAVSGGCYCPSCADCCDKCVPSRVNTCACDCVRSPECDVSTCKQDKQDLPQCDEDGNPCACDIECPKCASGTAVQPEESTATGTSPDSICYQYCLDTVCFSPPCDI